jgi:hypothetical protein
VGAPAQEAATETRPATDWATGLLPREERDRFTRRLQHAVSSFVEAPRTSVEEADAILEEAEARLAEVLTERHRILRESWAGRDSAAETEELRLALRRYRELAEQFLGS